MAMKLDPANGATLEQSVALQQIVLSDPGDASTRKLTIRGTGPEYNAASPGSLGDPTCGAPDGGGARLQLLGDGDSPVTEDIELPCSRWAALGDAARPAGYQYSDPRQQDGPCTTAEIRIKARRGQMRVVCRSSASFPLTFDLGGAPQQRMSMRLSLGAAPYCSDIGGGAGHVAVDTATLFRAGAGTRPMECR